ncbi:MAG: TolC family protein [Spirochaetaceae bacterium]|nr:TolC family protein [Spirochaetaceae bacterium]
MKHARQLLIIILLLLSAFVFAENRFVLTLNDAFETAMANNSDIQKQLVALEGARRVKNASWNMFLPEISAVTGSVNNSHTLYDGTEKLSKDQKSSWRWSAGTGISIGFSTSIPYKIKQNILNYQIAQTSYNKLVSDLNMNITSQFYSLTAELKNISILKEAQKLAKDQLAVVQANYNNGLASELDLLKAKYAYQSTRPKITQAQTTYNANAANFMLLLGLDPSTSFSLKGSTATVELNLPSVNELSAKFLDSRYDVQQAVQNLTSAELGLRTTQHSTLAPTLNLIENFSTGNEIKDGVPKPSVTGSFSASISIPISGWIPNSNKNLPIKSAKDAIKQAQISLEAARKNARQDISRKAAETRRIYESLEILDLNCQIANRAYELARVGYGSGLVSQTELESQQQDRLSAQQSLMQGEISYITSLHTLANALNISYEELISLYGVK